MSEGTQAVGPLKNVMLVLTHGNKKKTYGIPGETYRDVDD